MSLFRFFPADPARSPKIVFPNRPRRWEAEGIYDSFDDYSGLRASRKPTPVSRLLSR